MYAVVKLDKPVVFKKPLKKVANQCISYKWLKYGNQGLVITELGKKIYQEALEVFRKAEALDKTKDKDIAGFEQLEKANG